MDDLADAGDASALGELVRLYRRAGDQEGAERLRQLGLEARGKVEDPWGE